MRSRFKGIYFDITNVEKVEAAKEVCVLHRRATLVKSFIGEKVLVHSGKEYVEMQISRSMLWFKAGGLVLTKRIGKNIHRVKKAGNKRRR